MSGKYERTFTLQVAPDRAWRAFAEPREMEAWFRDRVEVFELRPGGHIIYEMAGRRVVGTVDEVQPGRLLQWTAGPGLLPGATVITVTFEQVEAGTRITITQSGFGDTDEWLTLLESHSLGWNQLVADLALYLRTGISFKRMPNWKSSVGALVADTLAGVEIVKVLPDGFAERAGLARGDLVVQLGRAPIFSRSDLWVLLREHEPGEKMEAAFVRDNQLHHAGARL